MTKCDFCIKSINGSCQLELADYQFREQWCTLAINTLSKVIEKQKLLVAVEPTKEKADEML